MPELSTQEEVKFLKNCIAGLLRTYFKQYVNNPSQYDGEYLYNLLDKKLEGQEELIEDLNEQVESMSITIEVLEELAPHNG